MRRLDLCIWILQPFVCTALGSKLGPDQIPTQGNGQCVLTIQLLQQQLSQQHRRCNSSSDPTCRSLHQLNPRNSTLTTQPSQELNHRNNSTLSTTQPSQQLNPRNNTTLATQPSHLNPHNSSLATTQPSQQLNHRNNSTLATTQHSQQLNLDDGAPHSTQWPVES